MRWTPSCRGNLTPFQTGSGGGGQGMLLGRTGGKTDGQYQARQESQ